MWVVALMILAVILAGCLGEESKNTDVDESNRGTSGQTEVKTTATPSYTPTYTPQYVQKTLYSGSVILPKDTNIVRDSRQTMAVIPFIVDRDNSDITIVLSSRPYGAYAVVLNEEDYYKFRAGEQPSVNQVVMFNGDYTLNLKLNRGKYYLLLAYGASENAEEQTILLHSGVEVIKAGHYLALPFKISENTPEIAGKVIGKEYYRLELNLKIREDLDINILLFDKSEFDVWANGGTATPLYFVKRGESGDYYIVPTELPRVNEEYVLVLDNSYSILTKKTVEYSLYAFVDVVERETIDVEIIESWYE